MTFVNEPVPKDYYFDPNAFTGGGTRDPMMVGPSKRWVIDYDQNIFIIELGGTGPDSHIVYALSIKGQVIKFDAWMRALGNKETGYDIEWEVVRIHIPTEFKYEFTYVCELIEKTLKIFGDPLGQVKDSFKSISVGFNLDPKNYGRPSWE